MSFSFAETKEIKSELLKNIAYYPSYKLNATSVALQRSALAAQISGHVQSVAVHLGSQVQKGETLATLDCTIHNKNLSIAKAQKQRIQNQLNLQKKQLNRQLTLLKTNNISQTTVDQSETTVAVSESSLNEQKARIESLLYTISLCEVIAPFSGTIIHKNTAVGQVANPAVPLFTLLNTQQTRIKVSIPQHLLKKYKRAQSIQFTLDKQSHALTKELIVPQYNANRSIEARLIPNKPITVGASGHIHWQDTTTYLPAKYLRRLKQQLGVYIIRGDSIDFHVIVDAQEGRDNAVNLPLDTRIITDATVLNIGEKVE